MCFFLFVCVCVCFSIVLVWFGMGSSLENGRTRPMNPLVPLPCNVQAARLGIQAADTAAGVAEEALWCSFASRVGKGTALWEGVRRIDARLGGGKASIFLTNPNQEQVPTFARTGLVLV